jgi:protein SCO1
MKALRIWLPLLTLVSACGYFNSTGPNAENVPANSALSFGALPDVQLIDATGREVSPARLKGSAWALALISRPLRNQSRTLTKALGDLSIAMEGTDLRLVCLTMDPLNDTPEELAVYANQNGIDHDTWMLWTGPEAEVFRLKNAAFRGAIEGWDKEQMGEFMKRAFEPRVVVIDPEGRVRGAYDVFSDEGPALLLDRLRAVARE